LANGNRDTTRDNVLQDCEFDARTRPWYIAAKTSGRQIWSDIYTFVDGTLGMLHFHHTANGSEFAQFHRIMLFHNDIGMIGMSTAYPFYNSTGHFKGVFGADVRLQLLGTY
jgi:hypothetical protein